MSIRNIEIQDSNNNIYYPHTSADVVKYGATSVSKALEDKPDYECGVWSPQVASATTGKLVVTGSTKSFYIKNGNLVKAYFNINIPSKDPVMENDAIVVTNLPFLINTNFHRGGYINYHNGYETNSEFLGLTLFDNDMQNNNLFWLGTVKNNRVINTFFREFANSFILQGCYEYYI